jgi:hypothetical protein
MVRLQTLDLRIGVRVPASQPFSAIVWMMKMLKFGLFLIPSLLAFGQEASVPSEKAPPEVNQALQARIDKFYGAFIRGKFREAYLLVSEDSQDAFMESAKDTYASCETIKIDYTDNFTKAKVFEKCHGTMAWHGANLPSIVPLTTHWKFQNGDWDWCYVRPAEVVTPWGVSKVPPEDTDPNKPKPSIPDAKAMVQGFQNAVKADKELVTLHSWENSKEVVHLHNDMPGTVDLKLEVPKQPGLKVRLDKTTLDAGQDATLEIEYRVDDAEILCGDCAKKVQGKTVVTVLVEPIRRLVLIGLNFEAKPAEERAKEAEKAEKKN